jgi:hypothetical protein
MQQWWRLYENWFEINVFWGIVHVCLEKRICEWDQPMRWRYVFMRLSINTIFILVILEYYCYEFNPIGADINSPCNNNEQCYRSNQLSICVNGMCFCSENMIYNSNNCYPRKWFQFIPFFFIPIFKFWFLESWLNSARQMKETCELDEQCSTVTANSICDSINKVCACNDKNYQAFGDLCIKSNARTLHYYWYVICIFLLL